MIQSASHPVFAILEMHVLVFHKITGYSELERTSGPNLGFLPKSPHHRSGLTCSLQKGGCF